MPAPNSVIELVERFRRNYYAYKAAQYNETQLRREFVDPLFEALGWDVNNRQGYAEAYKDVVHEDSLQVEGSARAPDYSFRVGGVRKFFVETKKPSVNLKNDPSPAFQLRRYAWSAKLPLSILTDFEEFAVYDTRVKPSVGDKASAARIQYLTLDELIQHWDERVAGRFSREAVLRGDFDRFATPTARRRGTTEVDDAFLEEIEKWRELLAKNIALRNPAIGIGDLNFAVQMTIDRIVFLRIAEGRGLEDLGKLRDCAKGAGVYGRLLQLFRQADARYNSGLFHFRAEKGRASGVDDITPSLAVDDKPLKEIITRLYYPESPYEFALIPAEILGQVYERFLGKIIRLTDNHRAVVEPKPEVRKAGGVYYTPTYVVNYIVRRSLEPVLKGKKPTPASGSGKHSALIRVLDPACGSGSFLLGAYEFLLNWHRDWYVNDGPEAWTRKKRPTLVEVAKDDWRLTTVERKRILLEGIFGVDIDSQAVEVTKLSLLLKVLEGESEQTLQKELRLFHERALPDLDQNIKRGNSLIGDDYYSLIGADFSDEWTPDDVRPFSWENEFSEVMSAGGFDAVVGNPPYDVMEKDRGNASWPHGALAEYAANVDEFEPARGGKLNLFRFFVVRSLALVRERGRFGMIVPLALLADISTGNTRRYLLGTTTDLAADCFPQKDNPQRRVFRDAKLSTAVVTAERRQVKEKAAEITVRVYPWNRFEDDYKEAVIRLADTRLIDPKNTPVPLVDASEWELCTRIHRRKAVRRLGEVSDFEITRGEINQTVYRKYITSDPDDVRMLKGVEVAPYFLRKKLSQGEREWFNEAAYLRTHALRSVIHERRIATQRITGVDERLRVVACIVEPPAYFADSTNSIVSADGADYELEFLLGILNATLMQWRFKLTSTNNNVGTNELDSLPFPCLNMGRADDRAAHDGIVRLVKRMMQVSQQLASARTAEREALHRRVMATEREINQAVYRLYGLGESDIAIVERRAVANPTAT